MHDELARLKKELRFFKFSVLFVAAAVAAVLVSGFGSFGESRTFDEIKVRRVIVVDSTGRERVLLAGDFAPRRSALAGLLFFNEDGGEAGGLVYKGTKRSDGTIDAGAILTFDQYKNDQIVGLEYAQLGDKKRQGLTIQERPDSLSPLVLELYRAVENAPNAAVRDSLVRYYRSVIPQRDIVSRRLFVGRDFSGSSVVTLSDLDGKARLRLKVDDKGDASITFLDQDGNTIKEITP